MVFLMSRNVESNGQLVIESHVHKTMAGVIERIKASNQGWAEDLVPQERLDEELWRCGDWIIMKLPLSE